MHSVGPALPAWRAMRQEPNAVPLARALASMPAPSLPKPSHTSSLRCAWLGCSLRASAVLEGTHCQQHSTGTGTCPPVRLLLLLRVARSGSPLQLIAPTHGVRVQQLPLPGWAGAADGRMLHHAATHAGAFHPRFAWP